MSAPPARRVVGGHPARAARVARALQALEGDGWVSLSKVHRPGGGRRTVDHLMIGPGGVVVVDSHPWVGCIEVTRGAVRQNGFWREPETAEVAAVAGSVAALLQPQHRTAVHALICVAQHDLQHHVVHPGVHVVGVSDVGEVLRGLPQRLHPAEILQLHTYLRHTLAEGSAPEQLTTAELDRGAGYGSPDLPELPGLPGLADAASLRPEDLFAPTGRGPDVLTRPAARRRRPARAWRAPDWRAAVTRMVLAALVAVGVILLGPTVLHHSAGDAGEPRPPLHVPPSVSVVPAPYSSAPVPLPTRVAPPGGSQPAPTPVVQEIADGVQGR